MTHKRTSIRHSFKSLLESFITGVPIESNRAHKVSAFPLINIVSGEDAADTEGHASNSTPRTLTLIVTILVSSLNHDDDMDALLEQVESVVAENRTNGDIWSYAILTGVSEPTTEAGDKTYSQLAALIDFQYEA